MDLSHADAMALLFDDLTPHLERENGQPFTDISVLIATSARAVVLAPRLEAAACAVVTGRITDAQRNPWQVELNVTRSEFYSDEYARLELQPSRVQPDGETRGDDRRQIGGSAWLTAVNCYQIVDGDRVDVTITDLSLTGVGFYTSRVVREHDRLMFHGRFFADEVDAEVRVASVRESAVGGRTQVGARFIAIDTENRATIARIISGNPALGDPAGRTSQGLDVARLRELLLSTDGDRDDEDDDDEFEPPRRRFRLGR